MCAAWNGGAAIHGLQNANGTIAHVVTDPTLAAPRNFPLQWTCTNDAWEFVPDPTNPNNYVMNQIPLVKYYQVIILYGTMIMVIKLVQEPVLLFHQQLQQPTPLLLLNV